MQLVNSYRFGGAAFSTITDSFNRANSTTTMGDTDTGQTWVPNSGTWGIENNLAYCLSSPGAQATTVVQSSVSDCTIQFTMAVSGDAGVCFRSTDDNNHFITNNGSLFRKQGGGFTSLGSTGGYANGDVLKVVLSGSSITVYRNGSSVLAVSDSFNSTATKHGLRWNNDSPTRFNDFSITVP